MAEERSQQAVSKRENRDLNKGSVRAGAAEAEGAKTVQAGAAKAEGAAAKVGGLEALVQRVMQAQNILVALSKDPDVDELVAAIGLTMALHGMQKNATAVYSGETPNAIRFLKPNETFEKSIDGLRDFIVALNKSKAGRIEYREEGDFVRVYISPKGKKISEKDLEFARGAVNVDLVITLNAKSGGDLDAALTGEESALKGKAIANISTKQTGGFGQIEWHDEKASSVSEMVTVLLTRLQGEKKITREVATALLTGIVAKTDRFMGDKTTPSTMNVAQKLMMAGANPILIAESMKGEGILNENDGLGFMEGEIPERKTPKGGSGSLDAVSASGGSDVSGATMASGAGQVSVGLDAAGGGSLQKVVTPEEGAQARVAAEEASRAVASANGVSEAAEVQVHNGRDSEEGGLHRLDKIAEEIVNEKREERVQTEAEDGEQADEKGDPGEVLGEGAVKAGDKIRKARIYPGDEGGEVMVPDMFSGKDYEAMMENELGDGAASSGGATEGASSEVSSGAVAEVASPETQDLQTNSPTMDAVGTMGGVENLAAVAAPEVASAPETNHIPEMNYAPQAGGQIEAGQVGDQAAVVQAGAEQVNNASQAGAEQAGLNQEAGGVVNFRAEEMTPISAPQRVAQPMSDSEVVQPWQMEVPEVKMEIPEAEVSEVSAEAVGTEVAQGEPSAEIPVEAVAAEVPEGSYSPVDGLPIPNGGVEETVSAEQVMPEQAAPEQGQDDPGAFRIPGM